MSDLDMEKDWWIQKVCSESKTQKVWLQVTPSIIDLKTLLTYFNLVLKVTVWKKYYVTDVSDISLL